MLRFLYDYFFFSAIRRLTRRASKYGRITLTQMGVGAGVLGWHCSIRAHERPERDGIMERHPQFCWMGEGETMEEALSAAIESAEEIPTTNRIKGDPHAPRLGGNAFDD